MVRLLNPAVGVYRPRQPLESDFHRLVREHFDDFRAIYPDCYARQYGFWRPVIDQAVHKFLKCGDLHHGFARVRCPDCRHEFFVAFSCKQRCICPSCSQKRTLLSGLHISQDICRYVPHRQFVWTIPKRLRLYFRFHRDLLKRLPPLAWQTVMEVYQSFLGPSALPGGILATQTFGTLLHFHPHLHGLITDGAFAPDGRFLPLPVNLTSEPFLRLWEEKVFGLLLEEGLIEPELVAQMRTWRHSGFNVDRSVRLPAGDTAGLNRLAQYMARSPFSLARLVRITPDGKVLYKADKEQCQHYPQPASADLFGGIARNFQVFEPLDFLAELTQHIPNKGEHLIRYYGCYSNKARGMPGRHAQIDQAAMSVLPNDHGPPGQAPCLLATPPSPLPPILTDQDQHSRRRWALLIQRIYQVDPLRCPQCGGTMKIITFIEARQADVIGKILQHCNLGQEPKPRPPPRPPPLPVSRARAAPSIRPCLPHYGGRTPMADLDPEFLEHLHREAQPEQLDLPWD